MMPPNAWDINASTAALLLTAMPQMVGLTEHAAGTHPLLCLNKARPDISIASGKSCHLAGAPEIGGRPGLPL